MTAEINNIYEKIGLRSLQNYKIGASHKVSDFNFYKLSQIEKLFSVKNVDWRKLSKSKTEIMYQINDLKIL